MKHIIAVANNVRVDELNDKIEKNDMAGLVQYYTDDHFKAIEKNHPSEKVQRVCETCLKLLRENQNDETKYMYEVSDRSHHLICV